MSNQEGPIRRPTEEVALKLVMPYKHPDPAYEDAQEKRRFLDVDGRAYIVRLSHRYVFEELNDLWAKWRGYKNTYPTFISYLRAYRMALYVWETLAVEV